MNARRKPPPPAARWLPAVAAGGLLAVVVGVGAMSSGGDDDDGAASSTESLAPVTTVAITEPAPTVTYDNIEESTDTIEKSALSQPLSSGFFGDEVQMVQGRLAELGFDPGPVDGQFGSLTTQAVWAFEKLVMGTPRAEARGIVTDEIWDRMQDPLEVVPRRPTGAAFDHVEIYLPEQVMAVFHGGEAVLVTHISTGELVPNATGFTPWQDNAAEYCETVTIDTDDNGEPLEEPIEKAICGRSYTPPGAFTAYKQIEGRRESRLGGMYDPIYINQGIAIHGANEVPLQPASHGCIRVNRYLGEQLQSIIDLGDEVLIWDGVTEPWNQPASARQMRFDYPDPNATTTTSTTTTTTTTTTVPETTVPPTTDAPPPATTTTTQAPATTSAPTTVAPTTAPPTTQPPATVASP